MLDYLFETSWEVCNKVGGIYAVLSTKAKTLQQQYKDRIIFIGPDLWTSENDSPYFVENKKLLVDWQRNIQLPYGIKVRVGRWDVPGKPIALLVDYHSLYGVKNDFYAMMWHRYGVDSLHAYGDYDDSCMFGIASAMVIESIVEWANPQGNVIAHFDEWTTGMGLLHVKAVLPRVATVFTTHATSIGRSISGNGKPLYDYMQGYNGDHMAGELNMQSKHSLEKAAAHAADSFTTVSEVTARECEQLLERRPVVTPNAFEQNFVPKGKKYDEVRAAARERMLNVAGALTGKQFSDDTLIVTTSGRCEFRNKGIDMYLDALNVFATMCEGSAKRDVVAFVMVPAWVNAPRTDLLNAMKKGERGLANPVITHSLHNHGNDCVENKINSLQLQRQNNVTVIYVPSYLNGDDGIMNMAYYDILCGVDLTVFPSYYEPWGYTPLESLAFSVPTITTDLAGFGQWILDTYGTNSHKCGTVVMHRSDSNYSETVHVLASKIQDFYTLGAKEVNALRKAAKKTALTASWTNFIKYYDYAYEQAINNNENNKK